MDFDAGVVDDGNGGYSYFPLNIVSKNFSGCPTKVSVAWDSNDQHDLTTVKDCAGHIVQIAL